MDADELPSERAARLAAELRDANAEAVAFVDGCSEDDWRVLVPEEGWPVGVVLHHVAAGHVLVGDWVDAARRGEDITITTDEIDEANARHAEDFAGVSREETSELLRTNGEELAALLEGLSDAELASEVAFTPAGGALFSAEQLCGAGARHAASHLGRVRRALGEPDAGS